MKENQLSENQEQNATENNEALNNDLILGKFKTIEDLSEAYKNMESQQGQQSKELGELRKKAEALQNLEQYISETDARYKEAKDYFSQIVPKYSKDEYFNNQDFTNLYQEAFSALGTNLNSEKFIDLLDKYVSSRINLYEKTKSANDETENIKSQMQFSTSMKNKENKIPNLTNLSAKEIDEFVARNI